MHRLEPKTIAFFIYKSSLGCKGRLLSGVLFICVFMCLICTSYMNKCFKCSLYTVCMQFLCVRSEISTTSEQTPVQINSSPFLVAIFQSETAFRAASERRIHQNVGSVRMFQSVWFRRSEKPDTISACICLNSNAMVEPALPFGAESESIPHQNDPERWAASSEASTASVRLIPAICRVSTDGRERESRTLRISQRLHSPHTVGRYHLRR